MASLVVETQLEKDVASNAGVIPIWPWLDENGKTKDGLLPNIYANMLLQAKRDNGQEGIIKRCDHDGCEHDYKAMFWRSADTPENIVPEGWTDFGGPHHFSECPNCRARDIQDIGLDEFMEDGRVDANLKHGSTGSSGASDKPLRPGSPAVVSHHPTIHNTARRTNMLLKESELKQQARKLFKNNPEHLRAVLKQIDKDERKKRANAAEDRRRKKDDEEYYEKRKRRAKKNKIKGQRGFIGGASRRKKKTRKRRKSRRKSRHKKRHRKKRTRRRR